MSDVSYGGIKNLALLASQATSPPAYAGGDDSLQFYHSRLKEALYIMSFPPE